jgi:hypothetical protein
VSTRTAIRALLVALAVSAAVPGLWATLAPHGFYANFPGTAHWVDRLPPYNAHLVTDVGAFYLGFAVLFAWAAVRPARALVLPACAAWAVFSAIHLGYHTAHLARFSVTDAIGQTTSLAVVLALPGAVWWLARKHVT